MLYQVANVFDNTSARVKDREKALILGSICTARRPTRKSLARDLKLRPTSISTAVAELIEDGLVIEGKTRRPGVPGRPELFLEANCDRLANLAFYVEARELKGAIVTLGEDILAEEVSPIPEGADNATFAAAFGELVASLQSKVPESTRLTGIGLSLVGTVATEDKRWVANSRWPNIRNLSFAELEGQIGIPIVIRRSLDTQLEYLLIKSQADIQNALLFHWGFGIGSAFSYEGRVIHSKLGRFGEIGHTKLDHDSQKKCLCGALGCLETEAAIWALLPEIRKMFPDTPSGEREFANSLRKEEVRNLPCIQNALDYVGEGLLNLYKTFYPDHLFIVSPFTEVDEIFEALRDRFQERLPEHAKGSVKIEALTDGFRGSLFGCVYPFFRAELRELLTSRA